MKKRSVLYKILIIPIIALLSLFAVLFVFRTDLALAWLNTGGDYLHEYNVPLEDKVSSLNQVHKITNEELNVENYAIDVTDVPRIIKSKLGYEWLDRHQNEKLTITIVNNVWEFHVGDEQFKVDPYLGELL